MKKKGIGFWLITAISLLSVGTALYIMANGLGLVDSLDFGAGAYYYADIPAFERFVGTDVYHSTVPFWVLTGLFLLWGSVMYRLWVFMETGNEEN